MEDEYGPINVIVKPDVYERDRSAVRMEPFLAVRGRLQKDGATLNVIAHEVEALRVPGAPVRRRGLSRSRPDAGGPSAGAPVHSATASTHSDAGRRREPAMSAAPSAERHVGLGGRALAVSRSTDDLSDFHASLPDPLEYWADTGEATPTPFRYLTALRQSPPGIKNFG